MNTDLCKTGVRGVDWISFVLHGDARGSLTAVENNSDIPFAIARIYYIYSTRSDVTRGKHAHRDLHQVLLCVSGSCDILIDDGHVRETVHLHDPAKGIYIHDLVWREMSGFSEDCVLLALVDRPYDLQDYIFDYVEFQRISNGEEEA